MPVRVIPLKGGKYRVTNNGRVTAKRTTKKKAKAQARLLRRFERGAS